MLCNVFVSEARHYWNAKKQVNLRQDVDSLRDRMHKASVHLIPRALLRTLRIKSPRTSCRWHFGNYASRRHNNFRAIRREKKGGGREESHKKMLSSSCFGSGWEQVGEQNEMGRGVLGGGGGERGHGRKGGEFGGKEGVREEEGWSGASNISWYLSVTKNKGLEREREVKIGVREKRSCKVFKWKGRMKSV